ncbi:hypothetical protein DEU56DRAFT_756084 [Suillus clintonianus]|uniref:uncharacterized protein n=1 Tax=Suillus clintonianus TaxID=1904413 RepID=UPI001B8706FB|nr:uncharacterized protein DEU56DRAFT_756084 [Suillus clintonianus]KAG2137507.1 hypothetical protein DEU56DRAFT_756084 [Suillus clintonianus]
MAYDFKLTHRPRKVKTTTPPHPLPTQCIPGSRASQTSPMPQLIPDFWNSIAVLRLFLFSPETDVLDGDAQYIFQRTVVYRIPTASWSRLNKQQEEDQDDRAFDLQLSEKDHKIQIQPNDDTDLNPGELTLEEGATARHFSTCSHGPLPSCTLLIVGWIMGTGIFSTSSSILSGVGSVGASLMLWVLVFLLSFIWLKFGAMFPHSGGEKVYLEAVYRKPKYLATIVFAANAIFPGFTASGCIQVARRRAELHLENAVDFAEEWRAVYYIRVKRVT